MYYPRPVHVYTTSLPVCDVRCHPSPKNVVLPVFPPLPLPPERTCNYSIHHTTPASRDPRARNRQSVDLCRSETGGQGQRQPARDRQNPHRPIPQEKKRGLCTRHWSPWCPRSSPWRWGGRLNHPEGSPIAQSPRPLSREMCCAIRPDERGWVAPSPVADRRRVRVGTQLYVFHYSKRRRAWMSHRLACWRRPPIQHGPAKQASARGCGRYRQRWHSLSEADNPLQDGMSDPPARSECDRGQQGESRYGANKRLLSILLSVHTLIPPTQQEVPLLSSTMATV